MNIQVVEIVYKLANGKRIRLEVSMEVNGLLEQADRQIRSQRRQDRRYLVFMENTEDLERTLLLPHEDIADLVIRIDSYRRLYDAIEALPECQRRRLSKHFFDGLSCRQIARAEKVHHKTVVESVERAIKTLRKYMRD